MNRFLFSTILLAGLSLSANSSGVSYFYIVQPGDTASMILFRAGVEPIYGKRGALLRVKALNQAAIDIDTLSVGSILILPEDLVNSAKENGLIRVVGNNQISFDSTKTVPPLRRNPTSEQVLPVFDKVSSESVVAPKQSAQSELSVTVSTGYSKIESSTGAASALLLSKPVKSVSVRWQQNWSEHWQSYLAWDIESISYDRPSTGTISGSDTVDTSVVAVGLGYKILPSVAFSGEFGVRRKATVTSETSGSVRFETRPLQYGRLFLTKSLVKAGALQLTAKFGVGTLSGDASGSVNVRSGTEVFGRVEVSQKLRSFSIFASGEYNETSQSNSFAKQKDSDVRTHLGVMFPLGGD